VSTGGVGYWTVVERNRNTQQGRGHLGLLVLLVVLAGGGYLAWNFVHQEPSVPVATTSPADNTNAHEKASAFTGAQAQAKRSGRAVQVAETFTDAELSSLANEAAQSRGMMVDRISLHATGQGTVQGRAEAHVAGQTVPISLVGVPTVTNNRVALNVTSTQVGAVPLPGAITDQVTSQLRQPLALGETVNGFQQLHVAVTEGQVTVSGLAQPA
jgi:uncharacterized protein YpmS